MDERVVDTLKDIKKELNEAQKLKEREAEKKKREKAEAESFEKMMQEEGAKKI